MTEKRRVLQPKQWLTLASMFGYASWSCSIDNELVRFACRVPDGTISAIETFALTKKGRCICTAPAASMRLCLEVVVQEGLERARILRLILVDVTHRGIDA